MSCEPPDVLVNPNEVFFYGGKAISDSPKADVEHAPPLDLEDLDRRLRNSSPAFTASPPPDEGDRTLEKTQEDYEEFVELGGWPARELHVYGMEDLFEYQKEYEPQVGLCCRRLPEASFWASELWKWKAFLSWRERDFNRQKRNGKISPSSSLPHAKDDDQYTLLGKYCQYLEIIMENAPEYIPNYNDKYIESLRVTKLQMEGILADRNQAEKKAGSGETTKAGSPSPTKRKRTKTADVAEKDTSPKRQKPGSGTSAVKSSRASSKESTSISQTQRDVSPDAHDRKSKRTSAPTKNRSPKSKESPRAISSDRSKSKGTSSRTKKQPKKSKDQPETDAKRKGSPSPGKR